ncbi:P-loop containing nucleoside triphosphate hydrolase protein [Gorgonomyces haynaldii]|nr:P-loop containing nucleoside triphosphate hydrolase protein [Gorgonomyces haynaldii]
MEQEEKGTYVYQSNDSLTPGSEQNETSPETSREQLNIEEPPIERKSKKKKKKPRFLLGTRNVVSQFFFYWVFCLVRINLLAQDIRHVILVLMPSESAKTAGEKLDYHWQQEKLKDGGSIKRALLKAFGAQYFPLAVWKLLWAGFNWVGMFFFLSYLFTFKENGDPKMLNGHLYALGILGCSVFGSLSFHQMSVQTTRIGIQCRAALMVLIYRKALKLSYVKGGVGDIVNLISNECNRIAEACVHWHSFWSAAMQCVILFVLCWLDIGISSLAPMGVIIFIVLPLQYVIASYTSEISGKITDMITKRVHLMSEVLTAIKLIKFYTWENFYRTKINRMREAEVRGMKRELGLKTASYTIVFTAPVMSTLAALATFRAAGNDMSVRLVFSLLFLFNTLRHPLMLLPVAERTTNGALEAFKRLQEFLLLPEVDEIVQMEQGIDRSICMRIENADFEWDGDLDHPHIYDLNLELKRNQVIGVVGEVGSCKSLLAAIMGQIKRTKGIVYVNGAKCGFIPQEPWLINASIRDNILFGIESEDEALYNDAIRISGLTRDILLLSKGDDTFVNEINLSPSQKQRLSIARCIVHNPDIVIMEDCLTDFDQNNARRLFKECIRNQLCKDKCVVMFTQQMQFLPECDEILVVKGGKVVDHGPLAEVKKRHAKFSSWVTDVVYLEDDPTGAGIELLMEQNINSIQNTELNEQTISKMIERNQGSVLTGNTMRPPTNFANQDLVSRTIEANQLTVHSVHRFATSIEPGVFQMESHQKIWTSIYQFLKEGPGLILGILMIIVFFITTFLRMFIFVFIRSIAYSKIILSKSMSWHKRILEAVLSAPMSFYDAVPLGHILSYFARHLFLVDEMLPESALQLLSFVPFIFGTIILVAVIVPWFWATLPLYAILTYFSIKKCISVQRKFQQLESNNKSPMFEHLSSTLEGLFSIRLYDVQDKFDVFNQTLIDADHKALYSMLLVKTFMALCLDIVSSIFIYMTALLVVLFPVSANTSALALVTATQLLLFVPWCFKTLFEMNSSMESVSALIYFGNNVRKEDRSKNEPVLSKDWPENGEIEFRNVTLRYNRYGVDVLKSVSFRVLPKEKIAIVGRSGSGKSTILMALMRITDPAEGKIVIDGIDTGKLSLSRLRSRIAVIPQEPVMLTGTIRSNLDPFEALADEEIWQALEAVHLRKKIQDMPDRLDTPITENGRSFSISERQLFCIARAILIKTSIVIFDEPTVPVDLDTELLVMSVIKDNFENATVIVLASRFRVIVQTDRVLVMSHGRVVEFDTPLALMDNPKSKFSLMLAQTSDIDPQKLRQLAQNRHNQKLGISTQRERSHSSLSPIQIMDRPRSANSMIASSIDSNISNVSLPHSMQGLFPDGPQEN